jgi:hypothetical protein
VRFDAPKPTRSYDRGACRAEAAAQGEFRTGARQQHPPVLRRPAWAEAVRAARTDKCGSAIRHITNSPRTGARMSASSVRVALSFDRGVARLSLSLSRHGGSGKTFFATALGCIPSRRPYRVRVERSDHLHKRLKAARHDANCAKTKRCASSLASPFSCLTILPSTRSTCSK